MTIQAMIAGVCYYWVILTRLQPDYTAEDTRTGGIDNYLSCYNTDSDCTVHPSAHIHRYLKWGKKCQFDDLTQKFVTNNNDNTNFKN